MKRYYKVIAVVAAVCACLIAVAACTPRDSEYRQIVECAQKLKSMAKDPESFSVYGECTYAYQYDDIDGYSEDWSTSRALDFLQAIIIETGDSYSKSYDADTVNRGLN